MPKYIIEYDRDKCIGCGFCAQQCDNWELQEDGKSNPKVTELDEIGCNQAAEDICPIHIIHIKKVEE